MDTTSRCAVAAFVFFGVLADGQVSNNQSLIGKYFFRQVLLETSGGSTVTQTASASGTLTFDGSGNVTINGMQLSGTAAATTLSSQGTYAVSPGGFITLSNPLLPGATVNARLGAEAVVGSSTEAGPGVFDLLIGLKGPVNGVTNRAMSGPYWVSSLEFPNGGTADIRNTNFTLTANGNGGFAETTVAGQANNLGNTLMTQTVSPISYLLNTDGSGTMTFPAAAGLDLTTQLIEGVKDIYLSTDGSFFIGGSMDAGGHGIVVGIKAFAGGPVNSASNSSLSGFYFAAGMRYNTATSSLASIVGSLNPTSQGAVWEQHTRQSNSGLLDANPLVPYSLNADGSGTFTGLPGHIDLASNSQVFSISGVDVASSTNYGLYLGDSVLAQSGPAPFLHPLGIFNAASYAPPGYPVSPGGFVSLFGQGLSPGLIQAGGIPFPFVLGQTSLTVNGIPAPLYLASPTQINAVVPYEVTGPTATFIATVGSTATNSVTVPLSPTAPGVFSVNANGLGNGAITHADYTVVSQSSPAKPGEVVAVYLTGLGAVSPSVQDGTAAPGNPPAAVVASVTATVGGIPVSNIEFNGLSPGSSSLYQFNIQIPSSAPSGPQTLQIATTNGSTSMVDVWVGQ